MKIRRITPIELELVKSEVAHFGAHSPPLEEDMLVVRSGAYREIFLLTGPLAAFVEGCDEPPLYMGIKLGEVVGERLRVSLEFATMLATSATRHVVALDEIRSTLFLYGRDIFKSHLPVLPLGRTLVTTSEGALLGIGIYDGRKLANVVDKGAYLRRYQ
ncbi:MAG TPA: hypothetical protein ENN11_01360 [Methanomicrobia archaeon]|nr:hypothetical protein [Methanomicrobia archaeon]